MSKKKMGKVLAAALCATTVATFYAAPVMAADLTSLNGNNKLTVNNNAITGVVDSDKKGSKNEFTINDQVTQFKTTVVQDSGRNKISSIRQNHEGVRLRAAEWTDGTATNGRFSDVLVTADSVKFGQGVNNPDITPNYTFTVDTKTGNLTAGTINGATIKGNSFNGAVIGGQKFNGVNVQELKAQVDGLNGNVATTNKNVAGIERTYTEDVLGQRDYTTTIEGTLSANDKGVSVGKDGKEVFHVSAVNGNVTGGLYNGVDVEKLQETTSKINEDTLGINRENGVTNIEGRVNVDKLGNVKAHGNVWSETGLTVGKVGEKAYFAVNGKGDVVTEGTINDVTLKKDGIKFGKVSILETKAGDALINGNIIGFDGITATGDLNVGLSGKFSVNGATGNLTTEGTINGATIKGNSFNGAVIGGQKFNGVNVQELKAQVDGLNGNVATTNKNVAGIERTYTEDVLGQRDYTTTIEGTLSANDKGVSVGKDGKEVFHVSAVNGNVTGGLYNGVDVEKLQETTSKINEDTLGINRENGVTNIEGRVNVDKLGNVKAHGNVWSETGLTVGKVGEKAYFAVNGKGDVVTEGTINDVTLKKDGIKFGKVSILETKAGDALINGNIIGFDGITATGNLNVGLSGKFSVNGATGDVTGGLYNGVNVEDLKADFDDLSGNVATTNKNVAGITRTTTTDPLFGQVTNTTTIEGVLDITSEGDIKLKNGSFAVDYNGNMTAANGAFKASQHGITVGDNAFHVDAATGNVTGGLYNGVDVKALSENVGSVNKNVAGIKRIGDEEQGYATVIEDKLQVGSDRMQVSYDGTGFVMTNTGTSFTGNVNLGDRASFNYGGSSIKLNDFYADYQAHLEDVKDYSDRLNALEDKTQHITADKNGTTIEGNVTVNGDLTANNITADGVEAGNGGNINANGTITGGTINGEQGTIGGVGMADGTITADKGTIGGVTLENGKVNGADITENSFNGVGMENGNITTDGKVNAGSANIGGVEIGDNKVNVGKTEINKDGVTVGKTEITDNDVVINKGDKDKEVSLQGTANKVDSLAQGMADMNGRINQVDEKINKVGAMAAAIANLRTMGYDPTAPTEIAVGVGQYRDETGAALGFFHYPNKNFMLSMSVSTSGDEVMGGIGATWKFGNKSKQESTKVEAAKVEEVKAEKADEIKKAARVAAQQKRHAEMAAKASK